MLLSGNKSRAASSSQSPSQKQTASYHTQQGDEDDLALTSQGEVGYDAHNDFPASCGIPSGLPLGIDFKGRTGKDLVDAHFDGLFVDAQGESNRTVV